MSANLSLNQVYTNPHLFWIYLNDRFVTAGKPKPESKRKCPIPLVHKFFSTKQKFHPDNSQKKLDRRATVAKYFEQEKAEQCLKDFTETIYDKKKDFGVHGISELKTWSDFSEVMGEMLNVFRSKIVQPLLDPNTTKWVSFVLQDDANGFATNMLGAFVNMLRFNFGIFKVIKDLKPRAEGQGREKYFDELKALYRNSYKTIRAFSELHMGIFVKALNINGVFDIVGSVGEPYKLMKDNFEIKKDSSGKEELVTSKKFIDRMVHTLETNPIGIRRNLEDSDFVDVNLSLDQKALGCQAKDFKLPKLPGHAGTEIGGHNLIKESFDWIDRVISRTELKKLEWN